MKESALKGLPRYATDPFIIFYSLLDSDNPHILY